MVLSPVHLIPAEDIETVGGAMVARSKEPWLRIAGAEKRFAGRWIRLHFRSSFFDDPVRPLIRFAAAGGDTTVLPLTAPVPGTAISTVRVPDDVVAVDVSPAARPGRFAFSIDRIETLSRAMMVAQAAHRNPLQTANLIATRLRGFRPEARDVLRFVLAWTALDRYDAWYRALARPFDADGIDRRRSDWSGAPGLRFVLSLEGNEAARLDATVASLQAQAYGRWSVHATADERTGDGLLAAYRQKMLGDPRLKETAPGERIADLVPSGSDRIAVIGLGDTLPDYALAVVIEAIACDPDVALVYGDEDAMAADGTLHSPRFKPDWSPIYQAAAAYAGRLACLRCSDLVASGCAEAAQLIREEAEAVTAVGNRAGTGKVVHIRRILYRRAIGARPAGTAGAIGEPMDKKSRAAPVVPPLPAKWPEVGVIVPTRDSAVHLKTCIQGLKTLTDYPHLRVIVIDNDSVEPAALALLAELRGDRRFAVLPFPGPFNFAAMCNRAASMTTSDILVLLNNDIAMIDSGWLKPLVAWAVRPDVGAVGGKLLYPDGRIQHAGIVIGSGGRADHLHRYASKDDAGYLERLQAVHEVAAVTGACLAVERSKFESVGGLDSDNLPVDLNDVDLCLRLHERGWRNVWTPASVLCHRESASRNIAVQPSKLYRRERSYFVRRWARFIADDPYFHPALSLFSHRPALDLG